jgi:hypothetical protein
LTSIGRTKDGRNIFDNPEYEPDGELCHSRHYISAIYLEKSPKNDFLRPVASGGFTGDGSGYSGPLFDFTYYDLGARFYQNGGPEPGVPLET